MLLYCINFKNELQQFIYKHIILVN